MFLVLIPVKANHQNIQEAKTRRIKLDEENPSSVGLVLRYIYGGSKYLCLLPVPLFSKLMESVLNMDFALCGDHYLEKCVSLWHIADFLMLDPLKYPVENAVHGYCDKRMKQLCTIKSGSNSWEHDDKDGLSPWALDMVLSIRESYKWDITSLKAMLMEFMWVGRRYTLKDDMAPITLDHFKDTPEFFTDLAGHYASSSWVITALWAPKEVLLLSTITDGSLPRCARCDKEIMWGKEAKDGQVSDPFQQNSRGRPATGWCRDCGKLDDAVPWRFWPWLKDESNGHDGV